MKKIAYQFCLLFALMVSQMLQSQERTLEIVKNGEVLFSIPTQSIDYMTVMNRIETPSGVQGVVSGDSIIVTWTAVENATSYVISRSIDGNVFIDIAEVPINRYVDKEPSAAMNYYRVKALGTEDAESLISSSSDGVLAGSVTGMSGLYLGVIGFNQILYNYPVQLLSEESKNGVDVFVDALSIKNGTLLYYSVDEAISMLQSTSFPDDLFSVAVVTFTDGLDQGSMMMNPSYTSDEEYLNAIQSRIKNEEVQGQPISAYSIGLRGNDVSDVDKFRSNLKMLASSPDNATEVTNMADVSAKFQEIAEKLNEISTVQTLSVNMPGVATGTRIRFTFDNITSADRSQLYIEGKFDLQNRTLVDVVYSGLSSTSGDTVQGTVDGIFVGFTFEGVRTDNNIAVSRHYMKEWTYVSSTASWQINSEFDKNSDSEIVSEKRSAAVVLVLDCSNSLGSQFSDMQENAKAFISTLIQSGTMDEPTIDPYPSDNFSSVPVDLSLAVVKDGVRYYVTKENYEKYDGDLNDYYIEGLTVIQGEDGFIIHLNDVSSSSMGFSYAKSFYGSWLPSYWQGIIMSARWSDINAALVAFGGTGLSSCWVNKSSDTYCYYINGSGGEVDSVTTSNSNSKRVRKVDPIFDEVRYCDSRDLTLAVVKDGERRFITQAEYADGGIPNGYAVEGLAVILPNEKFIVALENASSDPMTFDVASSLYGDVLPSRKEGQAIGIRMSEINNALISFGGRSLSKFWVEDSYCYINLGGGLTYNPSSSNYVRSVLPLE